MKDHKIVFTINHIKVSCFNPIWKMMPRNGPCSHRLHHRFQEKLLVGHAEPARLARFLSGTWAWANGGKFMDNFNLIETQKV